MNIDQFQVMDAVARLGSFSAAAKELNRVQSAVSYSIKGLEEELGVTLFSRETYRPELTEAGSAIYAKARVLLADVAEIRRLGIQLNQGEEALVALDITPTCPIEYIAGVLKKIGRDHPRTQFRISMEVFGGEVLVRNDEVDLSLTDVVTLDEDLEYVPWRRVRLMPVASPQHPLGGSRDKPISRSEVLRHIQIVVRSLSKHLTNKTLGVQEGASTWSVGDFLTKKQLIVVGLGWGNMPDYLIGQELGDGRLVRLEIPHFPEQFVNLQLVRKRREMNGPIATKLWDLLIATSDIERTWGA